MKLSLIVRHSWRLAILLAMILSSIALPSLAATTPLTGIKQISVGTTYACGLTNGGEVKCWGLGELGSVKLSSYTTATTIPEFTNIKSVSVGANYTCALTNTSTIKCVGSNVGYDATKPNKTDPTKPDYSGPQKYDTPTEIKTGFTNNSEVLSGVTAISTGNSFMCALRSGGEMYCWGRYFLWSNENYVQTTPSYIKAVGVVDAVSVGGSHACILQSGKVSCWGQTGAGQAGSSTTAGVENAPKAVPGLKGITVTAISARANRSCAIVTGGGVKCWGFNGLGELGVATVGNDYQPRDVVGLTSGVAQLALGYRHTCAKLTAGAVKCWGRNDYGEVGYNLGTDVSNGVGGYTKIVKTPTEVPGLNGSEVASVATSVRDIGHSCALLNSGGVKCWGFNFTTDANRKTLSSTPVDIVVEVATPPPPPPPTGNGINTKGERVSATFQNLIQTSVAGAQPNYSYIKALATSTDTIRLAVTVQADPTHVGQPADRIVILYRPRLGAPTRYMKVYKLDASGKIADNWEPWDGKLATLKAAGTYTQLPTTSWEELVLERRFNSGLVGSSYTIFVGYRLRDGTLIFNGLEPMSFYIGE